MADQKLRAPGLQLPACRRRQFSCFPTLRGLRFRFRPSPHPHPLGQPESPPSPHSSRCTHSDTVRPCCRRSVHPTRSLPSSLGLSPGLASRVRSTATGLGAPRPPVSPQLPPWQPPHYREGPSPSASLPTPGAPPAPARSWSPAGTGGGGLWPDPHSTSPPPPLDSDKIRPQSTQESIGKTLHWEKDEQKTLCHVVRQRRIWSTQKGSGATLNVN